MAANNIPLRLRATILWGPVLLLCVAPVSLQAQEHAGAPARQTPQPQASRPSVEGRAHTRPVSSRSVNRRQVKIRVRAGETWNTLAERFNVTADEVARLNAMALSTELRPGQEILLPSASSGRGALKPASVVDHPVAPVNQPQHSSRAQVRLIDGSSIEADDVWEDEQGVRYRRGGVTYLIERARVSATERSSQSPNEVRPASETQSAQKSEQTAKLVEVNAAVSQRTIQPVWIYLVGGARVEADDVTETATGVWYRRDTLSIYLDRSRIERIEREPEQQIASDSAPVRPWKERGWSTGNMKIDALIRQNGSRYGVDPYLIFCVMEQESHFNPRVVSPKGARGLMQLMPGTGARFGVRSPFDPAQNIMGGTRYLKQLLEQFRGRVDLVLAGYNAGEGAVMKYGRNVPPYKETRDYVKRISKRYAQNKAPAAAGNASHAIADASRLP